jgi:allantoate deiminase
VALRIDPGRLEARLDALAEVGRDSRGGWTRLAYTQEERAATELVAEWMSSAGLSVRSDAVGNTFGRWPRGSGTAVWTGSHVDTVPNGGRFDGPAGVLASLAAVEALQEAGVEPATPIEVCVFVGEEGSRFRGLLGSRAVVEGLDEDELRAADAEGTTLAAAMQACGLDPQRAPEARVRPQDVPAYLELHIEQGPVLEMAERPVGIVTAIAGPLQFQAEITGRADHAGTTPMGARADSLLAAAEVALELEHIASAGRSTVGTVGRVVCAPGAPNVIAGRTELSIDLRDIDAGARDDAERLFRAAFDRIVSARGLRGRLHEVLRVLPQPTSGRLVSLLEESAAAAGVPALRLPSGAAHDAMVLGRITHSGMVFVRSLGGRSHAPEEETTTEDLAAGAAVLAECLHALCA